MSEAFTVLHTQNSVGIGGKPIIGRELKPTVGDKTRKKLADISNMPHQDRYLTQHDKLKVVPNAAKDYIEQLQKENLDLKKILVERNKLIELTGIELHKLRIHLQKVQQQNLQLAQSNSQILHELNLGKDRLKALQHELGCKNGMLKAKDFEMKEHLKGKTLKIFGSEVKETHFKATKVSLNGGTNNGKTGCIKRGRQPKSLSSKAEVLSSDQVENKRPCTRRQPASFNDQELKPAEVQGLVCHGDFQSSDQIKNRRPCTRRQSARLNHQEAQPAEDCVEMVMVETSQCQPKDKDTPPDIISYSACLTIKNESTDALKQGKGSKRSQSARFKSQEPNPSEGSAEMDGSKDSTTICLSSEDVAELGPVSAYHGQESRRSSINRPSRQAVKKVQSYKEVPVNVKMRRPE